MLNKEKFLKENSGLINKAANRYFFETPKFSFDDLVSVGNHGAIKALNQFDPSRKKSKLTTYVYSAASREIRDFVRKNKYDVNWTDFSQRKHYEAVKRGETNSKYSGVVSPTAIRLDKEFSPNSGTDGPVSMINVLPSGAPPPEQDMMLSEQKEILMKEINSLPDRDKSIIIERHVEGSTFDQIGVRHGITKQRVQQVEERVMKFLRNRLMPKLGNFITRKDGLARRS